MTDPEEHLDHNTVLDTWCKSWNDAHVSARASLCTPATLEKLCDALEQLIAQDSKKVVAAATLVASASTHNDQHRFGARALRAASTAAAYTGEHAQAIDFATNARAHAQTAGDAIEAARALIAFMQPYCETGRIDDAIAQGEAARAELEALDAQALAARVDLNLGNVHKVRGDADIALRHLERALSAIDDNDPIRAHALNAMGECHFVQDDLPAADEAFNASLVILGDSGGLLSAIVSGNRADVAAREGRLQDALGYFARARAEATQLGAKAHAARLALEAAEALETGGLDDEALLELTETLPKLEAAQLAFESARCIAALGRLELRAGRLGNARERLDEAARRFIELPNNQHALRAQLGAVEACIGRGRIDEAAGRLDVASTLIAGPFDRAVLARQRSAVAEATGDMRRALEELEIACREADATGVRPLRADLHAQRSRLLRLNKQIDAAIEAGNVALALVEGIRSTLHADRLRAGYLARTIAAPEALVLALLVRGTPEDNRRAFEVVEHARSRGLIERVMRQMQGDHAPQRETPEVATLRKRLNALYAALAEDGFDQQRGALAARRQQTIDELETRLDRALIEDQHHANILEAPLDFATIDRALGPGRALIEFFMADGDVIAFSLLDGELEVTHAANAMARVEQLVVELHFQCRRRLRGNPSGGIAERMQQRCDDVLGELYELLVAPLPAAVRTAQSWLLVGHGALAGIPFHALNDGTNALIDSKSIAVAPSAAVALRPRAPRTARTGTLIVGVSDNAAPEIRAEAKAIAAMHTEKNSQSLFEEAATANAVLEALATVNVAHIACHGRFLSGSPRSSGLRLADRWLTVRDVNELRDGPSVVVLSGCETGLQPQAGADELLGLTAGFAAAGAHSIVASLWSVHDEASTQLMTSLHESIAQSRSVSVSLREAQLALRELLPHPAFWAPFFCSECYCEESIHPIPDRERLREGVR